MQLISVRNKLLVKNYLYHIKEKCFANSASLLSSAKLTKKQ